MIITTAGVGGTGFVGMMMIPVDTPRGGIAETTSIADHHLGDREPS
jgi:hypothetical protein